MLPRCSSYETCKVRVLIREVSDARSPFLCSHCLPDCRQIARTVAPMHTAVTIAHGAPLSCLHPQLLCSG
jgi:hypothetical protein